MRAERIRVNDISRSPERQLVNITADGLMPLAFGCDGRKEPPITPLDEETRSAYECSLDGVSALCLPKPRSTEEEARLVESFLRGLRKLFSQEDNWTFWQPLMLSVENCVHCQTCNEACPVYLASGRQEAYRPTYRSEVLRRIKAKYLDRGGRFLARLNGKDIDLNWTTIARLAELAYRCTLCRRCAQWCPMGVDNGLVSRELRKLFSQEMGIAPAELHELGTERQLRNRTAVGMTPKYLEDMVDFMEYEIEEKTGKKTKIPVDKVGADILFIHSARESPPHLESPEAFAIIFAAAGLSWTLSSELGYHGTNSGVWYDDVQFAKVALRQSEIARNLKVKKVVLGECGHAFKGLVAVADRILIGEANIPRESCLPLLEGLVNSGLLRLDPTRNSFPVTLHDPCNIVRHMGVVEPQRRVLRRICPQFREMEPHGLQNYCCGGGGGFAVMSATNFPEWRATIAGRMKLKQVLEAFQDTLSPETRKYVCAPCFTCKAQFGHLFDCFGVWEQYGILYGGLVELIVNAMADVREPFIRWEWH